MNALHRSMMWLVLFGCLCLSGVAEVQAQAAPRAESGAAEALPQAEAQVQRGLAVVDWIVIAVYGAGLLGVGWYYAKRTHSTED